MPDGITDRAADVWEPLVAIADHAGGDWPQRARAAAIAINTARLERDPSLGILLLADCRRLFAELKVERLTTETLVQALIDLDESPWGELRGKPIDARGVARRLRKYDVRPDVHRFDEGSRRGYRLEDFYDAFQRYLPAATDVTPVTHPQPGRGANVTQDLPVPQGSSISSNGDFGDDSGLRLSSSGDAKQALHEQLSADEVAYLESLAVVEMHKARELE